MLIAITQDLKGWGVTVVFTVTFTAITGKTETMKSLSVRGEWVFRNIDGVLVVWKLSFKIGGVAGYYPPSEVMRESDHPAIMSSGAGGTCLSGHILKLHESGKET